MKTVIFDIDGTLSDATHRLHHVTRQPKNWDRFFAEAEHDPIHEPIRELAHLIHAAGINIILVSGRPESIRGLTETWMGGYGVPHSALYMRPTGDFRPDYIVKSQILDAILADGHEILFTVDDRPSVVAMWRERGITCLQCRDWQEDQPSVPKGLLTLMVGPSGAGKSTWLTGADAAKHGIHPSHVLSSDQIRTDLCGDFRDQTKNDEVFAALNATAKARITHGIPTLVDATNLRRKDRLAVVDLAAGGPVRYIVIDRPLEDKRRDAGWRTALPFDLIAKHSQTFGSQLKDILAGDYQTNVTVLDLRGPP